MEKFRDLMEGQGLAEYALIISLVAIAVVFSPALVGPQVGAIFSQITSAGAIMEMAEAESGGGEPESEEPTGPPDCYGSLLLPIMVGLMGLGLLVSRWLPPVNRNQLTFGAT